MLWGYSVHANFSLGFLLVVEKLVRLIVFAPPRATSFPGSLERGETLVGSGHVLP